MKIARALPSRATFLSSSGRSRTACDGERTAGLDRSGVLRRIEPLSFDGRFVAIQGWRDSPGTKRRYEVAYLGPRTDGKLKLLDVGEAGASVVGWAGSGTSVRAIVRRGSRWDDQSKPTYLLVDPVTAAVLGPAVAPPSDDETMSPDGKRRVACRKNGATSGMEIVVSDASGGRDRIFSVHEDDGEAVRADCVTWASPRFLRLVSDERLAFIAIETMKMSYLLEAGDPTILHLSPDFQWAVTRDDEGLRAARIIAP